MQERATLLEAKRIALLAKERWYSQHLGFDKREELLIKKQRAFKDHKQNVYYLNKVRELI